MSDDTQDKTDRSEYIDRIKLEKDNIDPSYSVCVKLLDEEMTRLKNTSEPIDKTKNPMFLRLHLPEPQKIQQRVYIPIKEFPKFNFVGKLIGTKGATLKALQNATRSRISIFGRGSIRDKEKEEKLLASGEAKYLHLNMELHVQVEILAPPFEASNMMGYALKELSYFLNPNMQAHTLKYPGTSMPKTLDHINGGGAIGSQFSAGGAVAGIDKSPVFNTNLGSNRPSNSFSSLPIDANRSFGNNTNSNVQPSFNKLNVSQQKETFTYNNKDSSFNNKKPFSTRGNFKKDWQGSRGNRGMPYQRN